MVDRWLSIVGLGEEGWAGLSPVGRSLVEEAEILVGGDRHFAMVPDREKGLKPQERWVWRSPIAQSVEAVLAMRGRAVCVLASGDPMCYGIGATFRRSVKLAEMTILPAPSAFSWACARLGWPLAEVETLSLCGRDPALLHAVLYPGARILLLSSDRTTPLTVAEILTQRGFGPSPLTVLEHLGGPQERIRTHPASHWLQRHPSDIADLNTLALDCQAALSPSVLHPSPGSPGLPDAAYHHDGQLTKREVRALTLSALAPLPGQLLWDVGAGCGSIAIEWMRSDRRCRAIAIEQNPQRQQFMTENAQALGTPGLQIIAGKAPDALQNLPQPDAIFIGGGITQPGLLETCWMALRPGGRLVANTVTIPGEQKLFEGQQRWGGELSRIGIQRAEAIGRFLGWKALAPVTQWVVIKADSP